MRVYWSKEATERLRDLAAYIAKRSPKAAKQVAAGLLKRSRSLSEPPLLGRDVPEYPDSGLRELLERPYRLIYQVTDRGIEIVTVMHYRQQLPQSPDALRGQ